MIFVLWGDRFWARFKLNELVSRANDIGNEVFWLDRESADSVGRFIGSGIFASKNCIVGEFLLENPNYDAEIADLLDELAASKNIIILLEEELSDAWQEKFRKVGAKIQKFAKASEAKILSWAENAAKELELKISKPELKIIASECGLDPSSIKNKLERLFLGDRPPARLPKAVGGNYFNFADAVSAKNRHQALRLLLSYANDGFGGEEAFWKLWWKIKTLRMIVSGAQDLGLHPFVLKKSSEDLKMFSDEELKKISFELADIFSEVRKNETTFEEGLERLLLRI